MEVKELVKSLSLEDKAKCCSGKNFWELESVKGLKSIMMTDGPHGLRKQVAGGDHLGLAESVKSICFPTASLLASTWDAELLYQVGEHLGEECLSEKVSVLLGPGANIKRHPLCGRNFEYFSEDPLLSGYLASSMINGVQSKGVGTSLKHFVANNQETMRMSVDTIIDERTLREIYLKPFEIAVKNSQPWTIMSSYNKVNGNYVSEHDELLNKILKEEWSHQGLVVTDWGANNDRVLGLKNGQELEMPGPSPYNDKLIIEAVKNGSLDENILDERVERILDLIMKSNEVLKKQYPKYDVDKHHDFARKVASEGIVLLQNKDQILPLNKKQSVALIGEFAIKPRYQGSGSSLINPIKISTALEAFKEILGDSVEYAKGYDVINDVIDHTLITEAVALAKKQDVVILMVGLTESYESEGFDREHLHIPLNHLKLVEEISKVNDNVIVALSNGAPVLVPFKDKVKGIMECYLGGQASGEALADVVFGDVNPSGKLAETFPNNITEFPANQNFPGKPRQVQYREGLYVGYRYYDTVDVTPSYPFGYGLSYTTFEYSNLIVSRNGNKLVVSLKVKNTGKRKGKEVVQVYITKKDAAIYRPRKELKGFSKVELKPKEIKDVQIAIPLDDLKVYQDNFRLEDGAYHVLVGSSSRDIHLEKGIYLEGEVLQKKTGVYQNISSDFQPSLYDFESILGHHVPPYPSVKPYNMNTVIAEVEHTMIGKTLKKVMVKEAKKIMASEGTSSLEKMTERMVREIPFRSIVTMSGGVLSYERAEGLLMMMNKNRIKGLYKAIRGK